MDQEEAKRLYKKIVARITRSVFGVVTGAEVKTVDELTSEALRITKDVGLCSDHEEEDILSNQILVSVLTCIAEYEALHHEVGSLHQKLSAGVNMPPPQGLN